MTSYVLSYIVAPYFAYIYAMFSSDSLGGTFITPAAAEIIVGVPLGLIALLIFLLTGFGGNDRWWWIGVAVIPAVLFEILFDPFHIYFPIILGLIAWGLGYVANKTLWKLAPGIMAKIS